MPNLKSGANALLLLMSAINAQVAVAQSVATKPDAPVPASCKFSQPARIVASMRQLPAIASEFERLGIAMADIGEPFVPFDVVDTSKNLPERQFVRAYVFNDRVIVWYYHGGIGTHFHAVEFRNQRDTFEREPVLRVTGRKLGGPLCKATQAMLDGVTENDW